MKRIGIMALTCAVALLGVGTAALAAGKVTYTGNLSQSGPPQATIKLNVRAKRDRGGKEVVKVTYLELRNATYKCSDGEEWAPGSTGGNQSVLTFSDPRIVLKGRSFSTTLVEDSSTLRLQLSATIPKHGEAKGTARLIDTVDAPLGDCDSGVVSWTAAPQ